MDLFLNISKAYRHNLLAKLLLIFFIFLALVTITRTTMDLSSAASDTQSQSAATPPPPTRTHLNNIAEFHLFGTFNQNLNNLPQTMLQLTLQGIALSTDPGEPSRAIISAPDGQTNVYRAGQTVPGGAIIKEIKRDLVVLDDNNQLESLSLPVPQLSGGTYTSATEE